MSRFIVNHTQTRTTLFFISTVFLRLINKIYIWVFHICFVDGNLVTWRSKKQKIVALSSTEVEFRGMEKGLCELLQIKRLLSEIGFGPDSAMILYCNNKAAIEISHNLFQHDRTKHIEIYRHFIIQNLEEWVNKFYFVRLEDQLADLLTKAILKISFCPVKKPTYWYTHKGSFQ